MTQSTSPTNPMDRCFPSTKKTAIIALKTNQLDSSDLSTIWPGGPAHPAHHLPSQYADDDVATRVIACGNNFDVQGVAENSALSS